MDKKHSKKIKRANKKKKEKKVVNEQHQRLAKQIHMFDRMPNKCSACNVEFVDGTPIISMHDVCAYWRS